MNQAKQRTAAEWDRWDGIRAWLERAAFTFGPGDGSEDIPADLVPAVGRLIDAKLAAIADELAARGDEVEWACRWVEGELTPARDEEWARKHAQNWGTTPVCRAVGPWREPPTK